MARVKLKTLVARSKRNMKKGTHKIVRDTAIKVIKQAYKEGINAQISEGHRSNARQNVLYRQGRTTPGAKVTNAKAGESFHNYGIAVDFFLTSKSGNKSKWTVNNNWRRVAAIGKSYGFEWGGDWTTFKDYPHLQMTGGLSLKDLQNGKRPKLKRKKSGAVSSTKRKKAASGSNWTGQNLSKGSRGAAVTQLQEKLAAMYFYPNKGAKNNGVDGIYGDKTLDAVKRFQSVYLPHEIDGIAGIHVYNKLK